MKDKVVLLAVTKMLSGFCVGGISLSTRKWIRLVKEFGTILIGDIRYQDKTHLQMFDAVEFELIKHRPAVPHIEDWITEFVKLRPTLLGRVRGAKREEFLKLYAEKDTSWFVSPRPDRSLSLVGPCNVSAVFRKDTYSGKYDARLVIEGRGDYPVTDLKWRAFGRTLVAGGGEALFDADAVRQKLNAENIYVSFGLSRLHEGRYWPLIVGVHTVPDYEVEINYAEP